MYNFSCSHINNLIIEYPHRISKNCKQYDLTKDGKRVGTFLAGDKFSFIEFSDRIIRIDRVKKLFKKDVYSIVDHKNEHFLGSFNFLDNHDECILSLTEESTYFFHRNSFPKKIGNPKTWFSFNYDLTDSKDIITFSGKTSLKNNPTGNIESTNPELLLPTIGGLFIIEENIRRFIENSG